MKRREFLKTTLGIAAVPAICVAKLSKDANVYSIKSDSFKLSFFDDSTRINFDNIKITGTFNEWIKSIRAEIERVLTNTNCGGEETYSVEVRPSDWGTKKDPMPAKAIVIMYTGITGMTIFAFPREITHFSFAECEFKHKKARPEYLKTLVNVRFIDMLWSLEDQREKRFKLLRKFDSTHKTPDCYEH